MAKNNENIIDEIEAFKTKHAGNYPDYYIGITNNLDRRLIENSSIIKEHLERGEYTKGNPLYTEECLSRDNAVTIERFFQNKGMEKLNKRSFGRKNSKFIYCYKMTEYNRNMILSENSSEGKVFIHLKKILQAGIQKFNEFINEK